MITASNNAAVIDLSSPTPREYTYQQLLSQIELLSAGLTKMNFSLQSKIAILADNSIEYIITYFAIRKAGLIPVLINHKLSTQQISNIINDSAVSFIFYDAQFFNKLPAVSACLLSEINTLMSNVPCSIVEDPTRPAFIMYTSGSTGDPVAVTVTTQTRNWLINNRRLNLTGIQQLAATPMYHMNGLSTVEISLNNNATIVLLSPFDEIRCIKVINQYLINRIVLVPPMMAMMIRHTELMDSMNFDSVTEIVLAGAPTSPQLYYQTKKYFKNAAVRLRYGMTELGPALFGPPPPGLKEPQMSVGYPRKGFEYKLINGVLHIKTPLNDKFFNTKDRFTVDENGFYFFIDRADDMFVSGGENIFPSAVQKILESHPDVRETVVIGLPDNIKGMKPYAFVVKNNKSLNEDALKEYFLNNGPAYQMPRNIWFIDSFPLSGTNKIDKKELKNIALEKLKEIHNVV
jgi:long-chain acyl-CoA synthetase